MKLLSSALLIFTCAVFTACGSASQNNTNDSAADTTQTYVPTTGIIMGPLSYPSDAGIPGDYIVEAQNIKTGETFHTIDQDIDMAANTYILTLPPGEYYVYSYLLSEPDKKAYYNEFVTCGMSVNCKSHEKIVVPVRAGDKVPNIEPGDWYNF